MKKSLLVLGCVALLVSCNNASTTVEQKSAYVDTQKLMQEYEATKDVESKYKIKSEEMGKELEADIASFQKEAASFQANAQAKGMAWAQQKGAELQQREQELGMKQQSMMQTLQMESGQEMDSIVKTVKATISDYGKKNGYDYIYGTEDASTVLYAKEEYNITDLIVKELNSKYKGTSAIKAADSKVESAE